MLQHHSHSLHVSSIMKNNRSLWRRPETKPKKKCGFLDLPGEVRNEIYKYYFTDEYRCEIVGKGTELDPLGHKMTRLGFAQPQKTFAIRGGKVVREVIPFMPRESIAVRFSGRLGKYKAANGRETSWESSLCALILVSKLIHRESIVFFYHRTTFVFNAPKRISSFLQVIPAANLALVTKLELHYSNYGHERFIGASGKDSRQAHIDAWTKSCKAIAKKLVNLRELNIWIYATQDPLWFDLREKWLTPLLCFRRRNLASQRSIAVRNNCVSSNAKSPRDSDGNIEKNSKGTDEPASNKTPDGFVQINVYFDTYLSRPDAFEDRNLSAACIALHRLFGNGISRALMGASEEEAMTEFMNAWEGEYAQWRFHLKFQKTGW